MTKAHRQGRASSCIGAVHWVIDGESFDSTVRIMAIAKSRGADFSMPTLKARLRDGENTWEELLRPIQRAGIEAANVGRAKTRDRKRDEMAELIAALDQRKRDMGLEP
jgi:hypothetical protein